MTTKGIGHALTSTACFGYFVVRMKRKVLCIKAVWVLASFVYVSGLTESDKDIVVETHNNIRRKVANGQELHGYMSSDMKKMVWSLPLQLQAEASLDCSYSTSRPVDPTQVNVNIGVSPNNNITQIIGSWISEKRHLYLGLGYTTCTNLSVCNRFLKMINSQHWMIGCAYTNRCRVNSRNVYLLVCQYGGGEMLVPPFKQGTPCTGCDEGASFCENGLCVACNTSSGSCDCRKTCNKANIGTGVLDSNSCTCECLYGLGPNCDQDCVNPMYYDEFDICSLFTAQDCLSPFEEDRRILRKSCPATCTCRRHPNARQTNEVTSSS